DTHREAERDAEADADHVADEDAPAADIPGEPVLARLHGPPELSQHVERARNVTQHRDAEPAARLPQEEERRDPREALPHRGALDQPPEAPRRCPTVRPC